MTRPEMDALIETVGLQERRAENVGQIHIQPEDLLEILRLATIGARCSAPTSEEIPNYILDATSRKR